MAKDNPLPFDPIAEAVRNWDRHGWEDAAPGMALVTSIMRVHQLLVSRIDAALEPYGLTFARFEVLMLLSFSRTGRLPLGKIGRRLQVHPASVTNAIDRLERDGLVTRVPHPSDGRTTLAAITPAGRRLARRSATALNEHVFAVIDADPRRVRTLVDALAELREAAGDFESDQFGSDPTTPPT